MNRIKLFTCCAIIALLQASIVQAQLTWDPDGDQVSNGGTGTWDLVTSNWDDNGSAPNTTWVNGNNAFFGELGSNYTVAIANGGVTIGDLTHSSTNILQLKSQTDNLGVITIKSGGATWNTAGGEIEFFNDNNSFDTPLSMTSGDTLTVTGGGTFDTGQNPGGDGAADWSVAGATLDFQAGTLRGQDRSVGRFDLVKMVGGSTFVYERNSPGNNHANNWELGAGVVTFDNRYGRQYQLGGEISGPGTLEISNMGGQFVRLANTNNSFTGGVIVDSGGSRSELQINAAGSDAVLGAVPGSFVSNNITLRNDGELKLQSVDINANRGITLDNGGIIVVTGGPTLSSYGGKITGTGPFQIGRNAGADGNTLVLTSNTHDYTGATIMYQGSITLGIDNAIPTNSLLTIGGKGTSRLIMNGYDQTIGGLNTAGGNTRQIENNAGGTNATLTINVADSNNYNYGANIVGSDPIHIVKGGLGVQQISRSGNFGTQPASLTVNGGFMAWNSDTGPTGQTTVNSGGTLGGIGTLSADVVLNSGARIAPGNIGGHNRLKIQGNLDLSAMTSDNAGGIEISFGGLYDQIIVTNALSSGTIEMNGSDFFDLGFDDFTFIDTIGIATGVHTIMVANAISGTVNPTDSITAQAIGDKGAMGTLSLDGTAIILTVTTAGDNSKYAQWANGFGLPIGAENDDTDSDGYDNLQEFAYGGDPTNAALVGYAPVAGSSNEGGTNWLTLAYGYRSAANPGVTYECLTTDDLIIGAWTNAGITVLGTNTLDADFDTITNAIPIDGTLDFLGVFLEK